MKPRSRRWARWTALLAPIGVPSQDGRVIGERARIGRPAKPLYAYLVHTGPDGDRTRLGMVTEVIIRNGWLTAGGELFVATRQEAPLLERMAVGELFPEMALREFHTDQTRGSHELQVFTRGIVAAVQAGTSPVWPDCRFILEES